MNFLPIDSPHDSPMESQLESPLDSPMDSQLESPLNAQLGKSPASELVPENGQHACNWRIAMAAVAGSYHQSLGQCCQDFARTMQFDDGSLLLVVADGAGSASEAEWAAGHIAGKFIELLSPLIQSGTKIDREEIAGIVSSLRREIATEAHGQNKKPRDYASTLVAVWLKPHQDPIAGCEEHPSWHFQIGDGGAVYRAIGSERWQIAHWPQHGEYANSTRFLTDHDSHELFEFSCLDEAVAEIALFSDGLESLLLTNYPKRVHQPFFNEIFHPLRCATSHAIDSELCEALSDYLATPRLSAHNEDDKCLILARLVNADE